MTFLFSITSFFFVFILNISFAGEEFPQGCVKTPFMFDCRGNVNSIETKTRFENIQRLEFERVVKFEISYKEFPNVKFIKIDHTELKCLVFTEQFPSVTVFRNGEICEKVSLNWHFCYHYWIFIINKQLKLK